MLYQKTMFAANRLFEMIDQFYMNIQSIAHGSFKKGFDISTFIGIYFFQGNDPQFDRSCRELFDLHFTDKFELFQVLSKNEGGQGNDPPVLEINDILSPAIDFRQRRP